MITSVAEYKTGQSQSLSLLYIIESIAQRILKVLKRFYKRKILRNALLAKLFPFSDPKVMLLGYPRSGTSWISKVLSLSPDVAYLREPISRTLLQESNIRLAELDASDDPTVFKQFENYAAESFSGIPPIMKTMGNSRDFFHFTRTRKTLLIKEVNLNATEYIADCYAPKTILLLRHPAGVMDSHMRIGWLKNSCEEFGYLYGVLIGKALKALKHVTSIVQLYEMIAENPRKEFKKLFSFLGVKEPENFEDVLDRYCRMKTKKWSRHQMKRSSENEIFKWKHNLTEAEVEEVKAGYFRSGTSFYREAHYWN